MKDRSRHDERPCVLVFRSDLLPFSETFIRAQAEALQDFRAVYAGMRRVDGGLALHRPVETLCATASAFSRVKIAAFEKAGYAPGFLATLRTHKPAIVHAHFAFDGLRAAVLAKRLSLPLVVTLHGYDVTRTVDYGATFAGLWRQADRFLCVSEYIRSAALAAGFPANKLVVHYTGIDLSAFPGREHDASQAPPTVLFVGRLAEKKGCIYLIRAMADVQRQVPDATLHIIGEGPERERLEQEAIATGARVVFAGRRSPAEIHKAMAEAAVFCAPSIEAADGDSEGLGMVFLEAQASGLPIVSTEHGGIPEAVQAGVSGLLAPTRDAKELARCILHYLQSPTARDDAGAAGRRFVAETFDLQRRCRELEEIYRTVMQVG